MALQSFQQQFTKNGLHPGFDDGLELPLMFLAAGGNLGQKIEGGEDPLPQACFARPFASRHPGVDQRAESFADYRLEQREFVGEVIVKGSSIERGSLSKILHRNLVKGLFGQELLKSL